MEKFTELLKNHSGLEKRRDDTQRRVEGLKDAFNHCSEMFDNNNVCAYCAGSLGRGDVGKNSDLDIFFLTTVDEQYRSNIAEIEILSEVLKIGRELEYPEFSNDGEFLKIHSSPGMLDALGAPRDDSENLFTTRMLLLLESRFLCNEEVYNQIIEAIVSHYFRDSRGKKSYRPLFLLNDLLRFWRTLCLNYEIIRDEPNRPWRKKNINLKFSRMLTVFATILPLITVSDYRKSDLITLTKLPPLQRFSSALDRVNDKSLLSEFLEFLNLYDEFLCWKENMGESADSDQKFDQLSRNAAKSFSDFIYKVLTHSNLDSELKKYLVL